jgi:type IV pilus assembly protein PilB
MRFRFAQYPKISNRGPSVDHKSQHQSLEPAMDDLVVGSWLVQAGIISADQLIKAVRFGHERSISLRDALIELRFMPHAESGTGDSVPPLQIEHKSSVGPPITEHSGGIGGFFGNLFGGGSKSAIEHSNSRPQSLPFPHGSDLPRPPQAVVGSSNGAIVPTMANQELHEVEVRQSLRDAVEFGDVPELTEAIFNRAIDSRATDVHFDPRNEDYRIRFRVDGLLHDITTIPYDLAIPLVSRIKLLCNMDIVERRVPQDGRIGHAYNARRHDLRVSTMPAGYGEKIVVRIHDAIAELIGLNQLGLFDHQSLILERLLRRPNGMMLVSGPVGSGKTTTLYSFMGSVNSAYRNLMSIEDPIEYRLDGVNQVQVDSRAEMGFSEGLRAMLRQDPDVIMIGEIRDHETAQIGLRAALTGVLVFSTTHAGDAATTISNLHNFSVPSFMLAGGLLGIVGQRLIRKVCPYCQIKQKPDPVKWQALGLPEDERDSAEVVHGQGCPACFHTGYLGRIGAFEILEIDDEIRDLIMRKSPKDLIRHAAEVKGMQTLKSSVVDHVRGGITSLDEAIRVAP